jgi:hypothetical protein
LISSTVTLTKKLRNVFQAAPKTPQYLFTVKDIVRIVRGLAFMVDTQSTKTKVMQDWTQLCYRVFSDRLLPGNDYDIFAQLLEDQGSTLFEKNSLKAERDALYLSGNYNSSTGSLARNELSTSEMAAKHETIDTIYEKVRSSFKDTLQSTTHIDLLSHDVVRVALKMAVKLFEISEHIIVAGCYWADRVVISQISSWMGNAEFVEFEYESIREESLLKWELTLTSIYKKILSSGCRYTLFLDQKALEMHSDDIKIMMNNELPERLIGKIVDREIIDRNVSVLSELFNLPKNQDDTWGDLLVAQLPQRVRLVISLSDKSKGGLLQSFHTWPFLRTSALLHWIPPMLSSTVYSRVEAAILNHETLKTLDKAVIQKLSAFVHFAMEDVESCNLEHFTESNVILVPRQSMFDDFVLLLREMYFKKSTQLTHQLSRLRTTLQKIDTSLKNIDEIESLYYTRSKVRISVCIS